ncbi:hypothetical protein FA15DRAFT_638482 [Coprinopsis marcescibilis]|uniref:Peptidase S28 n=1 Tax=Coprinopsis marcescibilis TaxID=230819 RepID=A0A5C3LCC9_COPMA|nr:hypothetical protein FA15DRAFT_638482 [Coprinopsis marcescibilis]
MPSRSSWRLITSALLFSLFTVCSARLPDGRPHANTMAPPTIPALRAPSTAPIDRDGRRIPPYEEVYYFEQLVDHNDRSKGTFLQRFWFTYERYRQGGPIVLCTPGEANAEGYTGYLTNSTMPGMISQRTNGANIVLEHRFYGESNPYPDLSVESFRVHTIQQAIDDLEYFAKNAVLPMVNGDKLTPDRAPWILVGGSYAGALVSWTIVDKPGVFFAGYSSSAPVQAILSYWEYFEPVRQYMPQNCSADVQAVVAHLDQTFNSGNETAIEDLKDNFGLGTLVNPDDVLSALRNNLWDWQSLQPQTGPGHKFYQFCDALEVNDDGVSAPASGWGLEHALNAWGFYWRTRYYSALCRGDDAESCLGTSDPTLDYWTNTSVNNWYRSWFWIVCNEVGYLQNGAPSTYPSIVSRLLQPPYELRQCQLMFPGAFSSTPQPRAAVINQKYKGWNVQVDRVVFIDGARDPWRNTGVSARSRTPRSTALQPVYLTNGFHCSDMGVMGSVDPTVGDAQQKALGHIATWLRTWRPRDRGWSNSPRPGTPIRRPNRPSRPRKTFTKSLNGWFRGTGQL